jgi:hypothetical protein
LRHIKKFAILAAVAVGVLAIPGTAAATHSSAGNSTCTYAQNEPTSVTQGDVTVYAETTQDGSGSSGTADAAAGVCMNDETAPTGGVQGGTLEAGAGSDSTGAAGGDGAYVVLDGDDANPDPADGYQGLSNYETGGTTASCGTTADDGAAGSTNSGKCFGPDGGPYTNTQGLVPGPMCGNTSGPTWDSTSRDGCSIP